MIDQLENAILMYRNNYSLEGTRDGGVLEISIDGGPFQDIVAAGDSFLQTVTISGLTIINGQTTGFGGGIYNDHAVLILNNCTITANTPAGNIGGGIHNDAENIGHATLQINNSLITNNSGGILQRRIAGRHCNVSNNLQHPVEQ
jgi:hypothetical protein